MPNPQTLTVSASDITTTTMANRQKVVADAISKQVKLLDALKKSKTYKPFSGGFELRHEVNYQEVSTFKFYSGYEKLDITPTETLSYLVFEVKQAAASFSMNGLEEAMNSGDDAFIDLMDERLKAVERTMKNNIGGATSGVYSNGTAFGGKAIGGLPYLLTAPNNTGIVGGVDRATYAFNRNQMYRAVTDGGAALTSGNVKRYFSNLYRKCTRNGESPTHIFCDDNVFSLYEEAQDARVRIVSTKDDSDTADALPYKNAKVIYDGGFGGSCPANTAYFINANNMYWRPHSKRNMVPLKSREAIDQDAFVQFLVCYANLTYDIAFLHGILTNT